MKICNLSWESSWQKNLREKEGVAISLDTIHIYLILRMQGQADRQSVPGCTFLWVEKDQTNSQLQQNLTTNITDPQKILLWPSNPNVPKSNHYFRHCYNMYQNSICLDQMMFLLTCNTAESSYPTTGWGLRYHLVQSLCLIVQNIETYGGK